MVKKVKLCWQGQAPFCNSAQSEVLRRKSCGLSAFIFGHESGVFWCRIVFVLFFFLLTGLGQVYADTLSKKSQVVVYYFYGNFRCVSCYRIETLTREALDASFKKELKDGELVFRAINVEEKDHEHFLKDYQLYTKSVVLSLMEDGREVKYKNLDKVWNYLNDKKKFLDYVKDETRIFLEERAKEKS